MKNKKINRCLCLLFVAACSILFMASFNAFAAHNDGSTKVTARIEAASTEASQPVTGEDDNSVPQDSSNISTGNIISDCVIVTLLILLLSMFAVLMCNEAK